MTRVVCLVRNSSRGRIPALTSRSRSCSCGCGRGCCRRPDRGGSADQRVPPPAGHSGVHVGPQLQYEYSYLSAFRSVVALLQCTSKIRNRLAHTKTPTRPRRPRRGEGKRRHRAQSQSFPLAREILWRASGARGANDVGSLAASSQRCPRPDSRPDPTCWSYASLNRASGSNLKLTGAVVTHQSRCCDVARPLR